MMELTAKEAAESDTLEDDAEKLRKMPSHFVYVEAPDDAGKLMRVGAMFMHKSEQGWALRLDKNDSAKQLVFEHGDDLVVLQNRRRVELAAKIGLGEQPEVQDDPNLAEETLESFEQATHPNRVVPGGPGPG